MTVGRFAFTCRFSCAGYSGVLNLNGSLLRASQEAGLTACRELSLPRSPSVLSPTLKSIECESAGGTLISFVYGKLYPHTCRVDMFIHIRTPAVIPLPILFVEVLFQSFVKDQDSAAEPFDL